MKYRYAGPGPVPDPENELVHPGDVRDYDEEPSWGPWELLDEPEAEAPPAPSVPVSVPLMTAVVAPSAPAKSPKGM